MSVGTWLQLHSHTNVYKFCLELVSGRFSSPKRSIFSSWNEYMDIFSASLKIKKCMNVNVVYLKSYLKKKDVSGCNFPHHIAGLLNNMWHHTESILHNKVLQHALQLHLQSEWGLKLRFRPYRSSTRLSVLACAPQSLMGCEGLGISIATDCRATKAGLSLCPAFRQTYTTRIAFRRYGIGESRTHRMVV